MINANKIFFLVPPVFILLVPFVLAQEKPGAAEDFLSKIRTIQKFFETNPIERTLGKMDRIEFEEYRKMHNVDLETATILVSLRNPFQEQIPSPEPVPVEKPAQEPSSPDLEPAIEFSRPSPLYDEVGGSPDLPIRPEVPRAFNPSDYNITGLIWDSPNPQAIINGRIVGIGETINEATITEITRDGVEVAFYDKRILIKR